MKQIIVRKVTLKDYIANLFYWGRFFLYRNLFPFKLSSNINTNKRDWETIFEDDFDKVNFGHSETTPWIIGGGWGDYYSGSNNYFGPPEILEGKSVGLFTVKYKPKTFIENGKEITIPFESSHLSSVLNFQQQYGRFECRCTIPHERGSWPAFWMWGTTWPPEIDVFEFWGHKDGKTSVKQYPNVHWGTVEKNTKDSLPKWSIQIENENAAPDTFHHFAMEWTPTKIEFFTDGIKIFRFSRKEILNKYYNINTATPWVVIGHGIDDSIKENEHEYYTSFLVDYVRVYKKII